MARWRLQRRFTIWVNKCIMALNWLDGWEERQAAESNFDGIQQSTVSYIEGLAKLQQPKHDMGEIPVPQAAYQKLLRGRAGYDSLGGVGSSA